MAKKGATENECNTGHGRISIDFRKRGSPLAHETGAVKRKRKEGLDRVTLVMTVQSKHSPSSG